MDASLFFCVVRHGRSILSWLTLVFQLKSNPWNINFTSILREIGDEISQQDTPMRKAVTPNRRLAIALYHLAPTVEYRTIGNLFGVSVAFVCTCIKEVCEAIRNKMASETSQSFKTCTPCCRIKSNRMCYLPVACFKLLSFPWRFCCFLNELDGRLRP